MMCTTSCLAPTPHQAHCGVCHLTFSGVGGFDRHRKGGRCAEPSTLGMARNPLGVWATPTTPEERARLARAFG